MSLLLGGSMDSLVLQLVRPSTSVVDALELLKASRRGGLVRQNPYPYDSYDLIYAGALLRARAKGVRLISGVTEAETIMFVDMPTVRSFDLDAVKPFQTADSYEKLLDHHRVSFGIVGETTADVMIVTRHEWQTAALSVTGGFQCNGTPTHYFPMPSVALGQRCPEYPLCSRPDGLVPTIEPA
jgi:hypothetical protein